MALNPGFSNLADRIQALQREGFILNALPADATEHLEAILPAYFADPAFTLPDGLGQEPGYSDEANRFTWAALGNYDLRPAAAKVSQPVLILWGEADPFGLPMAHTEEALVNAPVTFVLLGGCGHFWHECPEPFFSQVRSFLATNN